MNEYLFYVVPPWTDRLGWTLLHFVWQGAVIAGVFAIARALLFRSFAPKARYGLACAALGLMALAPAITFVSMPQAAARVSLRAPQMHAPAATPAEPLPSAMPGSIEPLFPWIVALWIAGAFACSLRLAGGWYVTASLRFAGAVQPAPAEWQSRLDAIARRIGVARGVRLLVSSLAQTPMAVGHLRPVVLVPLGALAGLPGDQLEALLAHELAHIWRCDYLANLLQSVVESLLFYHPAVWWVLQQIRAERELCCDDVAVSVAGDRVLYARALANIESFRPARAQSALAANGGNLFARIRRLVEPGAAEKTRSGFAPAVVLSVLVFVGGSAATVGPAIPTRVSAVAVYEPHAPAQTAPDPPADSAAPSEPARRHARPIAENPRAIVDPETAVAASLDLIQREPEPVGNRERERGEANQEPQGNAEPERQANQERERQAAPGGLLNQFREPHYAGRILTAIDIRGFSDSAGNELASRLPLRVGDHIAPDSLELIGRVAREYGDGVRVEYNFANVSGVQTVLRIHPAGMAGVPPINRK